MTNEQNKPDYMKRLPAQTDNEIWESIEWRFSEYADLMATVKLETAEEAIGKQLPHTSGKKRKKWIDTGPRWYDPNTGFTVRSWLLIPHRPERDEEAFLMKIEIAKELANKLKPMIQARHLTPDFLYKWGMFCGYAEVIETAYLGTRPNMQAARSGKAGRDLTNKDAQRLWFAKIYFRLKQEGDSRTDAEQRVYKAILKIIEKNEFSDERFPLSWYQKFLHNIGNKEEYLTNRFGHIRFTEPAMKRLIAESSHDIPDVNI